MSDNMDIEETCGDSGELFMPSEDNPEETRGEMFMSSEAFMRAEDSDQWDVLVSQGIGSETVSKWDRESLFIKFDPLVSNENKNEQDSPVNHELLDIYQPDQLPDTYQPDQPDSNGVINGIIDFDSSNVTEIPKDDHIFAIPKTPICAKLVPVETPPPVKKFTVPIAPIQCSNAEFFNVAPPGIEPDLRELGGTDSSNPVDDNMPPSLPNYNQMNGSNNNEAMIQEALIVQKEQFLSQLAEKEKMIKELREAKLKEESAAAAGDHNTNRVLVEYEKTMSSYVEQLEELKNKLSGAQVEKVDALKERDQALEDLKHVEDAFSLLHQKYERVKGTLENFRKNEEILKTRDQDLLMKLDNKAKKLDTIKEESTNRISAMCQEFEVKYSAQQAENLKLRALLRKNEMTMETLAQNLEQKQKENVELNKLCEELISGGLNVK